ncbi:MAG: SagB-type dehydrogenase family enzyme [Flavobacteriales bacterium]|jgi:SagB-type dehydrogenase family enzyme
MKKISLLEQAWDSEEFELFHESTKYDRHTIGIYSPNIARYLSQDATILNASRNYKVLENTVKIRLPQTNEVQSSLAESLELRKSCRSFSDDPISDLKLSTILKNSLASTRKLIDKSSGAETHARPYPSGGGLYPIDIYLIIRNIEGISACVAHYDARSHSISILNNSINDPALKKTFLLEAEQYKHVPVIVVFTSVTQRSTAKYGNRGYRLALLEAGHAAQNISLSCASEHVGCTAWASYFDDEVNELLGIDGVNESVVHTLLLGNDSSYLDTATPPDTLNKSQRIIVDELTKASSGKLLKNSSVIEALAKNTTLAAAIGHRNTGDRKIHFTFDKILMLIFDNKFESTIIDKINNTLNQIKETNSALWSGLVQSNDLIVVELSSIEYMSYCSNQIKGVKHIHLNQEEFTVGKLVHELTHSVCLSGNRFLDEGLALLSQSKVCGTEDLADIATFDGIVDHIHFKDFTNEILQYHNSGSVLSDDENIKSVYGSAYLALCALEDIIGFDQIFILFADLGNTTNKESLLNELIKRVPTMDTAEISNDDQAQTNSNVWIETPYAIEEVIAGARRQNRINTEYVQILEEQKSSYLESHCSNVLTGVIRLSATIIRISNLKRDTVDASLYEEFDQFIAEIGEEYDNHPLICIAKVQVIIAKLFDAKGMEARTLTMSYLQELGKALMYGQSHPAILIDAAVSEHYTESRTPEPNFAAVIEKLKIASLDTLYGYEAKDLAVRFKLNISN